MITTNSVDDLLSFEVEQPDDGLNRIVPGTMVRLRCDTSSFGMVVAVINTLATVMWTHKPFSHISEINIKIKSISITAQLCKLRARWSFDEN